VGPHALIVNERMSSLQRTPSGRGVVVKIYQMRVCFSAATARYSASSQVLEFLAVRLKLLCLFEYGGCEWFGVHRLPGSNRSEATSQARFAMPRCLPIPTRNISHITRKLSINLIIGLNGFGTSRTAGGIVQGNSLLVSRKSFNAPSTFPSTLYIKYGFDLILINCRRI
jgi:hypothetical protein